MLRRLVARGSADQWLPYAGAAVTYVIIGVLNTRFMLSWVVGFGYLLLWVWVLPALVRRLR
jgi:hypothetical protein